MRILIVTDHYAPFIGGAHRAARVLARELDRRGHQVTVATVGQPGLPAYEDDDGIPVHRLGDARALVGNRFGKPGRQRHHPPWPDPVMAARIRRLLGRARPDVVHAYGWIAFSAALAMTGSDVPMLLSARDYGYSCATRTLVRNGEACGGPALARCLDCAGRHYGRPKGWAATIGIHLSAPLLRRRVRGLHSISTYVEEITQRDFLGGAKVELRTIPSFRPDEDDVELDGGAARYLERLPDGPFMLFVGALRRVKGVETLLEAYVRLETHVPLVLIGTRERDTPKRFPLGVVVIEGVPHDAVMLAWERCLFGVVPSLWPEPMGQVVHEAMSRGRAVIGTTPGGHADLVVDGETGLLVPAGDVTALADTMARLLADDALRERLGSAAREHSLQATAGRAMPAYEDLYARVAAGARGA